MEIKNKSKAHYLYCEYNKRYSKEDIQNRLDVFMAYNRITEEQYAELMNLIDEVYGTENAENSAKTDKYNKT